MRQRSPQRQRPQLEELEPRILFSADVLAGLLDPNHLNAQAEVRPLIAPPPAAQQTIQTNGQLSPTHEIAFIDTRVPDYQALVDDLVQQNSAARQMEVFVLDPSRDGVQQISQILAQRHDVSALHLISHGADGYVQLGSGALNDDSLLKQSTQIKGWGNALTENGDLLIYGCDVAAKQDGQAMLEALSSLTGADVAASEDLTGNAAMGGNWLLEYHVGRVETAVALDAAERVQWQGVLVNSAPVLSGANNFATITEDQTTNVGGLVSTLIAGQVSDADPADLQGIAVTGKSSGNGSWQYSTNGGGSWNSVGGVSSASALLLRSTDLLRLVPDAQNGTAASVTFRAWDRTSGTQGTKVDTTTNGGVSAFSTATATSNITVTNVNDAPTMSNGQLANVLINTVNPSGQTVNTIFNGPFSDVDTGSSFWGIAVVGNTANAGTEGVWQYSSNGGSNWFAIGTVADGATALSISSSSLIRFVAVTDYLGQAPSLVVRGLDNTYAGGYSTTAGSELRVTVDTTTHGGTTAIAAATANLETWINTAPVLAGAVDFTTITEDQTTNAGALVSTLIAGTVSDADAGAVQGIAVTSKVSGNGSWQYSTNGGGAWNSVGAISTASALLLRSTDLLRFVPDAQNGTSASVTFRAWDQASIGTQGSKVDTTTNGGASAFSSATATSSITATSLNDAPTMSNGTLASVAEDTASPAGQTVNTILNGPYSDVDTGSSFGGIAVVGNTANAGMQGTWQYSSNGGTDWFAVGTVADGATALALSTSTLIRFVPVANYNGTPAALAVRALDDTYAGGFSSTAGTETRVNVNTTTRGGTTAIASASANLSTTISAVADTPSVTNATTNEDTQSSSGLVISRNAADGAEVTHFKITGISNGTLYKNDGTTQITSGTFITFAEANAGLKFTPAADFNGNGGFSLQASTSNVDAGLGGSTVNATITVNAVDDAPTASNLSAAETYTEDTTLNLTDIVVSDIDSATVTASLTLSNAAAGSLNTGTSGAVTATYNAGTGVWSASGATANVNNLLAGLTFTPAANFNSDFTIATSVSDGVAPSVTGTKSMIGVAVNDAPTNSAVTLTPIAEDSGARLITQAELLANASDVDGQSLTATGLAISSGSGALVDNGDGSWTYTPALNDDTSVSFSYSVTDAAVTVAGSATLDITPVNDAPTTSQVTLTSIAEDSGARLITQAELLTHASDVDGPSLTATGLTINSGSGALVDNGDGSWTYTPAPNDDTSVSFSYSVTDGAAAVASNAMLDITPVNDAPTASNLSAAETYTEDTALNLTDIVVSDIDSATVTASLTLSNAAAGSLNTGTSGAVTATYNAGTGVWSASGATANVNNLLAGLTFTPAANFNSDFTIATSVSDGVAPSVTGTKSMIGVAVNDAPTNSAVTLTPIAEDSGARLITQAELLANASDVDGQSLTATSLAISSGSGALVDNGDGSWTYTPALNDDTSVSFSYSVTDAAVTVAGSASLDITPVNDAPTLTTTSMTWRVGEVMLLSSANIKTQDVDNALSSLKFTVSDVTAGRFELVSQPGQTITSFSYDDLSASNVRFAHDASLVTPTFRISVSDGTSSSATVTGQVSFNTAVLNSDVVPVATNAGAAAVNKGSQSPSSSNANDKKPKADALSSDVVAKTMRVATEQVSGVIENHLLVSTPQLQPTPAQAPPSATVALTMPSGRTAEIDISQSVTVDDYVLRLVSLNRAEATGGGAEHGPVSGEINIAQSAREQQDDEHEFSVQTEHVIGISFTVGAVWWGLRVGGLLTSLIASLPAWRQLDLLLILPDDDELERRWSQDDDEQAVRDESAVGDILGVAPVEVHT